jgi:tetratricopeptide (TPR) repeat protein
MLERTYMGVDGRRDHSFRIPRPDLTLITGSPNTCNDCHADQSPDWAAQQVEQWFPNSDHRGPHFSETFAMAQEFPGKVAADLETIALSPDQPGLVRATALFLMQPIVSPELADRLAPLLRHEDPLVRGAAAVMQRGAPPEIRAQRLLPVLADPMQSVRIAAAKQMIDMSASQMTPSQRAASGEALSDWQKSLASRLDFPETHLVLGGMALALRNPQAAQRAFREAVAMDPQRAEAWSILVQLAYQSGGLSAARTVLREALSAVPDHPEFLQMLEQLGG